MRTISEDIATYYRSIEYSKPLSRAEEAMYARLAKTGDTSARDRLVEANLRFVVGVAKEYQGYGLTLIDLISEGNVGLMEAANRFDETKGFKFISYAVWWIRQAILKALASQGVRHISISRISDATKLKHTSDRLAQEFGREPTLEELARSENLSMERVTNAFNDNRYTLSLDQELEEGDGRALLDTVEDKGAENPFMYTSGEELYEKLNEAAGEALDEREKRIIEHYFGLGGRTSLTLEQVGGLMNLTRERIRQLRNRALEKMREHPNFKDSELSNFLA